MTKEDVYQLFVEYYGEERVDLQPDGSYYSILVHWPEVTVTNEYNQSIVIWDLYAKVPITSVGTLLDKMTFNRSTFDKNQWKHGYLHSHVPSFSSSDLTSFKHCCTGSGPINSTIEKLGHNSASEEFGNIWRLFCWELDKYVHIESLAGIPYNRLSYVINGETSRSGKYNLYLCKRYRNYRGRVSITPFITHLINTTEFKFNYVNDSFNLAYSDFDFTMLVSNKFIEWVNQNQDTVNVRELAQYLIDCNIVDNVLYERHNYTLNSSIADYTGEVLFTFKGKPVTLKCRESVSTEEYFVRVLSPDVAGFIAYIIITTINNYYGQIVRADRGVKIV